jgi:hypothetical protein
MISDIEKSGDKLSAINEHYISNYGRIGKETRDRVARLIDLLETRAEVEQTPQPGDHLIACGKCNYHNARIDGPYPVGWDRDDQVSCCVQPMTPFCNDDGSMSTSGGYFFGAPIAQFSYMQRSIRNFWTWGDMGPCAAGGVTFQALVNKWSFRDDEKIY